MRIWIIRMRLGAWEDICKKTLGLLISVGNKKVEEKRWGKKGGGKGGEKKVEEKGGKKEVNSSYACILCVGALMPSTGHSPSRGRRRTLLLSIPMLGLTVLSPVLCLKKSDLPHSSAYQSS